MVDVKATNNKLRDRAARIIATLTKLERDAALELLDACDGEVKTAIVSHRLNVTAAQARDKLADAQGHLGRVLG
jgi:N-acetylmuramic acid 6-phosphate etherase